MIVMEKKVSRQVVFRPNQRATILIISISVAAAVQEAVVSLDSTLVEAGEAVPMLMVVAFNQVPVFPIKEIRERPLPTFSQKATNDKRVTAKSPFEGTGGLEEMLFGGGGGRHGGPSYRAAAPVRTCNVSDSHISVCILVDRTNQLTLVLFVGSMLARGVVQWKDEKDEDYTQVKDTRSPH